MRLFAFVGSLLVLALLAALVVPPYVDWNQFKTRFEMEASRTLGLPVKVKGQAAARILPLPSVTFTDIEIGASGDRVPLLVADSFRIDVELAPLLKGKVVVVDMQLSQPVLSLDLNNSGRLDVADFGERAPPLPNATLSLENISISGGNIQLNDARFSRTINISGINVEASARSLRGPWQLQGTATRNEERIRFLAQTGTWRENGEIRLNINAEPQSLPYDFDFNGMLELQDGRPSWEGGMKISAMGEQDDGDLIAFRRPGRDAALPIRLDSDLEIVSGGATVAAFELDVGSTDDPYKVTGSGQAVFGSEVSFRIRAEGQQVNVERFSTPAGTGLDLSQRLALFRSFLGGIPQFDADGEINLYLPAVVAGDTVIREVGMDLRPAPLGEGWQIRNLEAQLPGRTDMRADGQLLLGDKFEYQGELVLASRQPSGLAKWLGSDASPAIRELSVAGFSADTLISGDLVEFNNVEIVLNNEVLKGEIRRDMTSGERPGLRANLTGDRVDFDQLASLFDLVAGGGSSHLASGHDLDLDLSADSMRISGLDANEIVVRLRAEEGLLDVETFEIGDMAGTAISMRGQVTGLDDQPVGNIRATMQSDDSGSFLRQINDQLGPFPLLQHFMDEPEATRSTELALSLESVESGYTVELKGQAGSSNIDARLSGDNLTKPLGQQVLDGNLVLVSDDATRMLLQLGVPVVPVQGLGRSALRVTFRGVAQEGLDTEATLTMLDGYLSTSGKVIPRQADGNIGFDGQLSVKGELLDIDQAILLSGIPFPRFGEGLSAEISSQLAVTGKRWEASDLRGSLGDAGISGSLSLDRGSLPRPEVEGELTLTTLDAATLAGLVYTGTVNQAGIDVNGETGQGRNQSVFAGLDADIDIRSKTLVFAEIIPSAIDFAAQLQMRDGDITLDGVQTTWLDGAATGSLSFTQTTAARGLNGEVVLDEANLEELVQLAGLPEGLSGKVNLAGTFETAGGDIDAMVSQLTASGVIGIKSGVVSGLNTSAFASILKKADATDDEELAEQANAILRSEVSSGTFEFDEVNVPFTIAGGIGRINNVIVENKDARLSGEGRYELANGAMEFQATVAFDPGKEVVVGAVPEYSIKLTGVGREVERSFDTSLMSTYLGLRVSERREREFEAQKAEILERQRLQQVARIYALREEAGRIAEEERQRIKLLEAQQEKQRQLEEERRRREELERKRLASELQAAQKRAEREAAAEAGRREKRQQEIELLRRQVEEALKNYSQDNPAPAE